MAVAPLQIPSYYAPQAVDFSPLERLGQNLRKSREDDLRRQAVQQYAATGDARGLFASGDMSLAQLGAQLESRKEAQARDARDFQFRQDESRRAQSNADRQFQLQQQRVPTDLERRASAAGLQPGSQEYKDFMLRGGRNADAPFSATDKKAVFEAEDAVPQLQGTIEALNRALELNNKTFTGYTAGMRGAIGSKVPGGGLLVDRDAAMATEEWSKIMGPEALNMMANTLKGATTDFELRKYIEMLADPSTPPNIRKGVIERMKRLAERKMEINQRRIQDLRGGNYFRPGGGQSAPRSENNAGDPLAQARDAINRGADPNAVRQRLLENGIDPSGL